MRKVSPNLPFEYYTLYGVVFDGGVACRLGHGPVRERVRDSQGRLYRFVGLAGRDSSGRLDVSSLEPGEWIVEPDLIYAYEMRATDAA
uniref:hypothetical protein n=1 Tax=Rhizobium rhizogenes TaxID=359 RepID=UPI001910DA91|nr:hypothetical protein [Rhizobium rhizogenes]